MSTLDDDKLVKRSDAGGVSVKQFRSLIEFARGAGVASLRIGDAAVTFAPRPSEMQVAAKPLTLGEEIDADLDAEEAHLDAEQRRKRRAERLMYYST